MSTLLNSTLTISMIGGVLLGVVIALYFLHKIKNSQRSFESEENTNVMQKITQAQKEIILNEARATIQEHCMEKSIQLEVQRTLAQEMHANFDEKLSERQSENDIFENNLTKKEAQFVEKEAQIIKMSEDRKLLEQQSLQHNKDIEDLIEQKSGLQKDILTQQIYDLTINTEKLNISRTLMESAESLKTQAQKLAHATLSAVYLRYQPKFIWPKSSFLVQVESPEILQKHFFEESPLIQNLVQNTDCSLSILSVGEEEAEKHSAIKISGGLGVDKEVIQLTLEEIIARKSFNPEFALNVKRKNQNNLDSLILKMGGEALNILGLKHKMHPEILKLIGSLNYRTSHRQNQYFHSIEVACLAGMLANELGLDPELAKRSGILHDIGKVLDYKIEGSHAVISGDYAQRYGELEDVVDTVLAHHDDKIVETPYAYILKAADAMSGARPGARVDMEEGFNRRIDGISGVVNSFQELGVTRSAIMHAGREVHIYVDRLKMKQNDIANLAHDVAKKLEEEVEYPGQIRVTVIRRTEISEVA